MSRFVQYLLIVSALLLAWLLMQAVHEFGHVASAWATGGAVERVVLHPLAISRTDVEPNPHPLTVAWGGPIVGGAAPLALWVVWFSASLPIAWLARFFAGFCLLANGLYIGVGSFQRIGDAGDMLSHGSPIWTLWLFGAVTAPMGLLLWNGLGRYFGFGPNAQPVNAREALGVTTVVIVIIFLEFCSSSR